MSKWAYITGIVRADTLARTSAEAVYIGQTTVSHLPRVRGSEGDANLHVLLEDGHNCSSNVDEYDQFSNLYNGSYFKCFEHQTNILVTISGQLRDKTFDEALREAVKMLCRMAKYIWISECAVQVQDHYGRSVVITNKNGFLGELHEGFWEKEEGGRKMKIKVYPATGPAYTVDLPDTDPDTGSPIIWTQDMVDMWAEENLANVDSWEVEE